MYRNILHPVILNELAKNWLLEDTSSFDYASAVVDQKEVEFVIYMKSPGVLAGIPFATAVFSQLGLTPVWFYSDGDIITSLSEIARISGQANKLLLAERVVLNVLSRASGVATITAAMREQLTGIGWKGVLAGTRKTTPGFRMVEKYSLLVGGADMHRYDLSSMIMLKDNHVTMAGSILQATNLFTLLNDLKCSKFLDEGMFCYGQGNCFMIIVISQCFLIRCNYSSFLKKKKKSTF